MVSQKNLNVSIVLMVSICCTLFCPSLSSAQNVTLSVSDGAGVRGSFCCNPNYPDGNRVEVGLDNPTDKVGILQVDICNTDLGGHLDFSGYEVAPRAQALNHSISFNPSSHCVEVRFFWTQPFGDVYIAEGSGTVATLNFDVSQFASSGNCPAGGDLTMSAVQVRNESNTISLTVTEDPGEFCYYDCGSDLHCDDGVFCNGEEICFNNAWCKDSFSGDACSPLLCDESADQCYCDADGQCDDGLFCNGAETCNGGTGNCQVTPSCSNDNDSCTDDCDEGSDTCQQVCTADGPWDNCCTSSAVCASDAICMEEVTLTIGNEGINPLDDNGGITVSLANPSHQVKAVQVEICDEGDHLVCTNCATTGRATDLACTIEEQESGCCKVTIADVWGGATIGTGSESGIFTLDVTTQGTKPYGHCKGLNVDRDSFGIIGADSQPLVALPVDGEVCYLCTPGVGSCWDGNDCTNEECNAGGKCVYTNLTGSCDDDNPCTTNDQCRKSYIDNKINVCIGEDPCTDDAFYCDGVEYCGGGVCSETGDPCGPLSCNGDLCETSDVTLTVENASGREGVIAIALENNVDEVREVHFKVCDEDNREWLHMTADDCSPADGRAGAFKCSLNGSCAVGGNSCSPTASDCANECSGNPALICGFESECKRCSNNEAVICTDDVSCGGICVGGENAGEPCLTDTPCLSQTPPDGVCDLYSCIDYGPCDYCDTDLGNGCVGMDITSDFPLDFIPTGTGAIAYLNYTVDPVTISSGNYADINPRDISVLDDGGVPLSVTPQPGKLSVVEECEGDLDGDTDVDAADIDLFLADFGRSLWLNPCEDVDPCNGDYDCDTDVDSQDLDVFIEDFGRSLWSNPCPPQSSPFACSY